MGAKEQHHAIVPSYPILALTSASRTPVKTRLRLYEVSVKHTQDVRGGLIGLTETHVIAENPTLVPLVRVNIVDVVNPGYATTLVREQLIVEERWKEGRSFDRSMESVVGVWS